MGVRACQVHPRGLVSSQGERSFQPGTFRYPARIRGNQGRADILRSVPGQYVCTVFVMPFNSPNIQDFTTPGARQPRTTDRSPLSPHVSTRGIAYGCMVEEMVPTREPPKNGVTYTSFFRGGLDFLPNPATWLPYKHISPRWPGMTERRVPESILTLFGHVSNRKQLPWAHGNRPGFRQKILVLPFWPSYSMDN